jgi:hypothetical protein
MAIYFLWSGSLMSRPFPLIIKKKDPPKRRDFVFSEREAGLHSGIPKYAAVVILL